LYCRTQRLDERRHVSGRRELSDKTLDLALALVASPGEHLAMVFLREMRREQQDTVRWIEASASIDLGEVGKHERIEAVRAADVALQAAEEAVVVQRAEVLDVFS
jgi:hypothetical protein